MLSRASRASNVTFNSLKGWCWQLPAVASASQVPGTRLVLVQTEKQAAVVTHVTYIAMSHTLTVAVLAVLVCGLCPRPAL